ncbi:MULTISPECIES: DUF2268 domain-containing putative Zn-dependent protease [Oceanobacillus]|uniref:DUF2268 domain-containing putative Zn-dependent protease n=2 Tax=Oceanobacillus TaxID=182709 RepID=UPI0009853544|nr:MULTISPECIES: DUF2268 domain-containing putative Zn-dependent protease [Oceanobacillus]MBT2598622.1 hypothetical protein [Oceanobacillus sp. ISL-74]MBT2651541.1 hypothetical protein [Oceanobacillus sp. ISL-73]
MKGMRVICIILLLGLWGCDSNNQDIDSIKETNPKTNQSFILINAFNLFELYLEKVIEEGYSDSRKKDIYKEVVINPIYEDCFNSVEFSTEFIINNPPNESDEKILLNLVQQTNQDDIHDQITTSLNESSTILPTDKETTICIFPNVDPNMTTGYSQGSNKLTLLYDESRKDSIKNVIAHEYHHSVWTERYYDDQKEMTLLNNMVFEGKAVMFEKMLYPENSDIPIYPNFNLSMWEAIEDELFKTDEDRIFQVMQGYQPFPASYGYSEGYKMVGSFLEKHPDLTPEEWLGIDAKEVFEEGEYLSNYE